MPRRSKTDQDAGFMRSYWDEVREMQVDYGAVMQVYSHPSNRTGVFVFRMVAAPMDTRDLNDWGTCAVQFEYPNANNQSLPAVLWVFAEKLHNLVHEAYTEHADRARKRG